MVDDSSGPVVFLVIGPVPVLLVSPEESKYKECHGNQKED